MKDDCSYTTTFRQNLHYEVQPGRWEEVDLGFRSDGESHVADRNSTVVRVAGARLEVTDRHTGRGIMWVLPARPAVSGHQAGFIWRGLEWDYAVTDLGVKLQADVANPRGPQTYEFPYQLLRGGEGLVVDERGDLRGDGFGVPRAFALGADGEIYEAGAWQLLQGRRAAFDFDDSVLPQDAFPYVLDPTTSFSPTAAGDEGNVTKSGFPYPPSPCTGWSDSGSTIRPERSTNAKSDQFWTTNGFMSWDTSSLPDNATVTSSTLKFHSEAKADSNARSLTADWYSAWPIDCSDFSDSAQTSAIAGISLSTIRTPNLDTITTLSGAAGGISRTGRTGLRTHISGGQPTGPNSLGIWQLGNSSNMPSPQLNVDYSLPGGPPTIVSVTDLPDSVVAGETVKFSVAWSDSDPGDSVRALICKTNAVTAGSCSGGTWASDSPSATSPSTASYTTSTADIGSNSYFAFACDQSNACSGSLAGTFEVAAPNAAPSITSATDSPDPVSPGDSITFTVRWTDSNVGDKVRAVICRTDAISAGSCSGGTWASGGLVPTSPAGASATTSSADAGVNTYYAFACDQSGACSSSHWGTFEVEVPNSAPSISSAVDSPDPVIAGNALTFSVEWSDSNPGDAIRAIICKSNAVTAASCSGGAWATGSASSSSPATASLTTSSANVGINDYYAFACDQSNACSGGFPGRFEIRPPNAAPDVVSASDGPDPVTAGRTISFSVGWGDSNGDAARTLLCKTDSVSSGNCTGGAWATSSFSVTSPTQMTYATSSGDIGLRDYYAFVCDSDSACSSAAAGTFKVLADRNPTAVSVADSPDPVVAGQGITFSVNWDDPGDSARAVICRTPSINAGSCTGGAWATGAFSSAGTATATYTTTEADIRPQEYYAYVCDPASRCSSSLWARFEVYGEAEDDPGEYESDQSSVRESDGDVTTPAAEPVPVSGSSGAPVTSGFTRLYWGPDETLSPGGLLAVSSTAASSFALSGVVTVQATGATVPGAVVTLVPSGGGAPTTTFTDARGAFAFVHVPLLQGQRTYDLTVRGAQIGTYRLLNMPYVPDESYVTAVQVGPDARTYDVSDRHPASGRSASAEADDSSVSALSHPGDYESIGRVPPKITVAVYNEDHLNGDCEQTVDDPDWVQAYPWRFYVERTMQGEIGGSWAQGNPYFGDRASKAVGLAISNFGWHARIGHGSPTVPNHPEADVDNTSVPYQCFVPWEPAREAFKQWSSDVLDERVIADGKILQTFYLGGSFECPPASHEDSGTLRQLGAKKLEEEDEEDDGGECFDIDSWREILYWYYDTMIIRDVLRPPRPNTSWEPESDGVRFRFPAKVGDHSWVGWRYQVERLKPCERDPELQGQMCWTLTKDLAWESDITDIRIAFSWRGNACLKWRARAWNPAGWTDYARFRPRDGDNCVRPG